MSNIERQLVGSAREATQQGENTLGAQFMVKIGQKDTAPELKTEALRQALGIVAPEQANEETLPTPEKKEASLVSQKSERNHGGNGRTADRPALAKEIASVKTEKEQIESALTELKDEKEATQKKIADIKARIAAAELANDATTAKNWGIRLKIAEIVLTEIDKISPWLNTSQGKPLMYEWRRYTQALDRQMTAELKSISNPEAMGAFSSAQTEAMEIKQRIEKLRQEAIAKTPTKEIEALPSSLPEITSNEQTSPILNEVQSETTGDTWQDEATSRFEAAGGVVFDETIPTLTNAIEEAPLNTEQRQETFELSAEAKLDLTPEQAALVAQFEKNISKTETALEERAIKAGVLEKIKSVGEKWNSVPLRYKFAISGGMIATGAIVGAPAISSLFYIGALLRGAGGVGLFTSVDEVLRKQAEAKTGTPRTRIEEARHIAFAGGLSFAVAVFLPGILRDSIINPLIEAFGGQHPEVSLLNTGTEGLAAGSFIEIAKPGDSVWKMAEHQLQTHLGAQFTSLSSEQQTYMIDAIKDRIEQNPDTFGVANIDSIEVGKGIDFTNALNDKDFIDNALTHARGLNPAEVANIKDYTPSGVEGVEARTVSPEEMMSEPSVKDFTIPTAEAVPVEAVPHPDANVEIGDIRGTFKYAPDGSVAGFTSTGALNYPQTLESQKILNDGWRGTVLSNSTGISSLNTSVVEGRAATIYQYQQILDAFQKQGGGMSPEADYLREQIANIVSYTEKEYGDVFKDVVKTPDAVSAIPVQGSEVMPQQITPSSPEVIAYSNEYVHRAANDLFGSKGFLGFGAVDGLKSPHWLDFANRPALGVLGTQPDVTQTSGALDVGVHNNDALHKMQEGIKVAINKTGVQPLPGETIEKFLGRAAASTYGNIK